MGTQRLDFAEFYRGSKDECLGSHTAAVHALLSYLHAVGFEGAPQPLGIDDHGREVLSFIPGTVPWPDEFGLLEPRDRLARVARLIRDFHDAVTGFVPPPDAHWQVLIPGQLIPAAVAYQVPQPAVPRLPLGAESLGSGRRVKGGQGSAEPISE